ncbi:MAG: aspartate ammonia-lyase [Desulforegulaceae bacterium]|nr:aspartate ammonia-lyase [Desulforegulaceae bacterium]
MSTKTRIEKDFLGEKEIPSDAYYGVQTLRAQENFKITGIPISSEPRMIEALGFVKKATALANMDLEVLPREIGTAICSACDEVIAGKLNDQFVVDVIQGGAGTSTIMNANEVIANRAIEILGGNKGEYNLVHPNNHVNCSQSTNDAYPTSLRIALVRIIPDLMESLQSLSKAFSEKGEEFSNILKLGRTQMQDAVPMTLGREFKAFAKAIGEDVAQLENVGKLFLEINIGATAIGSGLNTPSGYKELTVGYLSELTGLELKSSEDLFEATWDTGDYVQLSGVLKRISVKLSKICNDLRLLSSGPRAGFNEINLPKMQPGSSIMPGKVNPVIPEVVNQIAFQVIGMDLTVTLAAESGQLQLNAMEPVMAFDLFSMLDMLKKGCSVLEERCVKGITANAQNCRDHVFNSTSIVTALNPIIGYEAAASIVSDLLKTNKSVKELVIERNLVSAEVLDEIFSTENLMNPKFFK